MKRSSKPAWSSVKLADVAVIQTGIAKNDEKDLRRPVELPYLRVANVQDGRLDLREIKTISVEADRVDRYLLKGGDVLMTEGGDFDKLGRGTVWCGQISPCLHQNHVFAVRVDRTKLLPEYLAAYCAAGPGRRYFLACSKQTTNLASINSSQLKSMPLRLPSLDEQRRIVAVLDACSELQALYDRLRREHQEVAAAKFNELSRGSKGVMAKLSDLVAINSSSLPEATDPAREIEYFDVSSDGQKDASGHLRFGDAPSRARRLAQKSDLVYATIRPLLRRIFIARDLPNAVYSTGYAILSGEPEITTYLYYALVSAPIERQIHAFCTGTGYPAINASDLGAIKVFLPDKSSRVAITRIIDGLARQMDIYRQLAERTAEQKCGLLQKLLTGEWRLSHGLPETEAVDVGA